MSVTRFDFYEYDDSRINPQRVLDERELGRYVRYADHESAITEARKQEREKCIAEILEVERDWRVVGGYGKSGAAAYLAEHLRKGLNQ